VLVGVVIILSIPNREYQIHSLWFEPTADKTQGYKYNNIIEDVSEGVIEMMALSALHTTYRLSWIFIVHYKSQ
jgi:hypothetical protein